MTSAAETLYPNQGSTTAPIREDYRQAAPAPAATPASSSAAAPAPDPAAPAAETPPAEPRSASSILYGDGPRLGNEVATSRGSPASASPPPAAGTEAKPNAEAKPAEGKPAEETAIDAGAKSEGDKPAGEEGKPEPRAEPEVTEELPAALKATRWQGPTPASVVDYEASLAPDGSKFEKGEQYESVKAALHAGGVPITAAIAVMDIVKDFARNGASNHTAESATKTLEAWAPGQSAQLIENARTMIDKMQKAWPSLRSELAKTNLDNSPRLVYALSQIYAARSRR